MNHRTRMTAWLATAGALLLSLFVSTPAQAQLTGSGTGTGSSTSSSGLGITLAGGVVQRYKPGATTNGNIYPFRDANLNPNDINFQDCEDDIQLSFNLIESGTSTSDIMEVWAGTTDCTQTTARSGGESPFCWQVAGPTTFTQTPTINIYARAITKYIDSTLSTVPNGGNPVGSFGISESACHTQTATGQVAMNIVFMFLPGGGDAVPDAYYTYSLNVDLVGPLAPTSLTAGIGDELLLLNWAPQTDSTIQGFKIYAEDQGPNGLGLGAEAGASKEVTQIYCPTSGTGTQTCTDAGDELVDGSTDATVAREASCTTTFPEGGLVAVADASSYASLSDAALAAMGCQRGSAVKGITATSGNGGACSSTVLVDKFQSSITQTVSEDGGTVAEASTVTTTSEDGAITNGIVSVGISEINASLYQVGDVGGNTTSNYIVQTLPDGMHLVNGHQYALAVAAYDDDGNVGLLSPLACSTPAPVIDFWDRYKMDGGLAGGGYCALEAPGVPVAGSVFGMGMGVAFVALTRRRRRRNS